MPPKKPKDFALTRAFDAEAALVGLEVSTDTKLKRSGGVLIGYLRNALVGGGVAVGQVLQISVYGMLEQFTVRTIETAVERKLDAMRLDRPPLYLITPSTDIQLTGLQKPVSQSPDSLPQKPVRIGGLKPQLAVIEELVESALIYPELFASLNLTPPRGILIHGPPGTGKSLIVRYLAAKLSIHMCVVTASSIFSKYVGEAEGKVKDVFEDARANAPSIVFIDEIDSICPSRDSATEEYQRRIVSALLTEIDSVNSNLRVVVVGTSNRPNAIDNALRRPGRFDKEIEIPVPSLPDRFDILRLVCEDMCRVILSDSEYEFLAENTHGYVGADLVALCREAGLRAIKRARQGAELSVSFNDFKEGLSEISPSCLRDVMVEVPKVYWTDIGGYAKAKLQLRQAVEWPLKHPGAFERLHIRPPKGVMLYGPPGCSKTMMAKAIATESRMNFLAIKGPELFSKYVGDSERAIREMFRKARTSSPCVLFIDELDSLGSQREGSEVSVNERVLCTLLNELDGIEVLNDVVVLAATNRPELIDKALIRPGRFDRLIYIPPPDVGARLQILEIVTSFMPLATDIDLHALAEHMEGFSGAEVVQVPREAGLNALAEDIEASSVSLSHFTTALEQVRPNITDQMLRFYEEFARIKH